MMPVPDPVLYRGMTRAALDRAYSPSSMVAAIEPFLERYAVESAVVRATHDAARWSTRAYAAGPAQTLDLFLPVTAPRGLLVFIHGGYWQALNKSDASFPAVALTAAGYAYAAINYTLAPTATMDEIVEENRQALGWLWRHRRTLGLNNGPLVVSGHSAGAQIAAMMLVTDWAARGIDPAFISGALLLGGVYDLEPIRLSYVNDAVRLDTSAETRNSPMFKAPLVHCPLVITWAQFDTDEFKRQSRELATRWGRADTVTFEQSSVNHFDSLFDWCDPTTPLFQETMRLLRGSTT